MKLSAFFLALCVLPASLELGAHPGVDAALAYFSEQIQAHPKDQSLYLQRGTVYSNDGQYPQALSDFQRAAQLGDQVLVSFDLGVLHYRQGDFEVARRYFDEYLHRFPDNTSCLEYRARLLRDMGDSDAAIVDYRRLFELEQHPNPGHYITVAEMLASEGGKGVDQALAILDQGNLKLGITPQLQQYAIQLELRRDRPLAALDRLRALQPILGQSPEWKVDMGELLFQTGNKEQAAAMLDAAALQISTLRKTPARLATLERINSLRVQLAPAAT